MLTYKKIISTDGTFKISLDILPIQLEKCDIDKHFLDQNDMKEIWKTYDMNYMLCIPPNKYNLTIHGKPRDLANGWSRLNIYVNKCNPQVQKCMNSTYTDKILSNFVLVTSYLSNSIDHYNTTHPFSNKIESTSFRMSNSIIKSYQLSLKHNKYKTDGGLIFEENETFEFFTSDAIWMDVSTTSVGEITNGQMLGKLIFENSLTISNYNRTYLKAQSAMANIGGIIKAIMIIFQISCRFLTRRMSYVEVSNSIFEYKIENKHVQNKIPITSTHNTHQRHSAGNPHIIRFNTIKNQDRQTNPITNQNISEG